MPATWPADPKAAYPRNPTFELAAWDTTNGAILTKPCGCEVNLAHEKLLDSHSRGYCPFAIAEDIDLEREIAKMRRVKANGETEFTWRYWRRWGKEQQRRSYLYLLEKIDRNERELGLGAYDPATIELMEGLAREGFCCDCGMPTTEERCPGCVDGQRHIQKQMAKHDQAIAQTIAFPPMMPIMHKAPERSYQILLSDKEYGNRSREEMLVEIGRQIANDSAHLMHDE